MRDLNACLACGGSDLFQYIDLGKMPLANSFHDGSVQLESYPLAVQCCRDCWHSQLTVAVDPYLMFDDYLYVSGTSETLREFAKRDCKGVGIEPCEKLAYRTDPDIPVHYGYWDRKALDWITSRGGRFDVITAFNVLGHTADPLTFLTLAKEALAPGGTIWVQTSQAHMVLDGTFDAIYHEHVSYFTPRSLLALANRVGLSPFSYEEPSIHGGSMLIGLKVDILLDAQFAKSPLYEPATYETFAKNVQQSIGIVRQTGIAPPLVGYGAAAKGMTFLNTTGLKLDRIVDDNPLKHGLLTPGTNIPVGPVVDLPKGEGAIVVLAWNFWSEILDRIRREHGSGHTVIRFLPTFEAVMT